MVTTKEPNQKDCMISSIILSFKMTTIQKQTSTKQKQSKMQKS